jgi:hypothetical protein
MRKWPLYAITAYRILATMGTFILAAFDAPIVESLVQDIFLILPDRFMCTPAIITANGSRFSPPRHCLLRAIMLPSLLAAGLGFLCQAVRPITNFFAIFLNSGLRGGKPCKAKFIKGVKYVGFNSGNAFD